MQTRPYPYERLAKLTRQQIALRGAVRDLWNEQAVLEAKRVASSLLGGEIRVEPGDVEIYPPELITTRLGRPGNAAPHVACVLERTDAALPSAWLLEITASDAQRVVDRVLGGDGSDALAPVPWPLDALSRGALTYVIARVLAALGGQLTLRDVLALPLAADVLPSSACALWPIALWLADQRMQVRLYVPEQARFEPTRRDVSQRADTSRDRGPDLSALPLTLIASAGRLSLPMSVLPTLQEADTLMLDDTQLTRAEGPVRGRLTAHLQGSGDSITCVVDDRGLTIEGFTRIQEPEPPMSTIGRVMSSPAGVDSRDGHGSATEDPGRSDFAVDAPIELQVEVARFSLTLSELQRLRPGDVLATGKPIGEHVKLRISGQAFAEGELVDIEGELGVKILSFSASGTSSHER